MVLEQRELLFEEMVCLYGRETTIHLDIQNTSLRIVLHFIENIPTVQLCPVSKYPSQDSSRSFQHISRVLLLTSAYG